MFNLTFFYCFLTGWHQGTLPEGAAGDFSHPGTPKPYTLEFGIRQLQEKHQKGEVAGELEISQGVSYPASAPPKPTHFPGALHSHRGVEVFSNGKKIPSDQILQKVDSGPSKINLGSLKVAIHRDQVIFFLSLICFDK